MAKAFNAKGIPSEALTSQTDDQIRKAAIQKLRSGELKYIFTVDLFNEGVDIPEANQVLFLRPTDSLTIFLQQLGRGLRHAKGKECLLVLDFVAQMHKKYRVDRKFAALLPNNRYNIQKEIEAGFPHMPPGCSIQLEAQAMEQVIANIKAAYSNLKNYVIETLKTFEQDTGKELTFSNYIYTYDIDPIKLLDMKPWYQWKNEAKGIVAEPEQDQTALQQAAVRVALTTGPNYLKIIKGLPESALSMAENGDNTAVMLHSLLWQKTGAKLGMTTLSDSFLRLKSNPRALSDLIEIADHKLDETKIAGKKPYPEVDLELHANYSYDQVKAALGKNSFNESGQSGPGVLHFPQYKSYALLVTLQKSDKDISPSTMYKDYPIGRDKFHIESQSERSENHKDAQNCIHHKERGYSIHLFVRNTRSIGPATAPFQYMGKINYLEHKGECPIGFTWQLEYPLP